MDLRYGIKTGQPNETENKTKTDQYCKWFEFVIWEEEEQGNPTSSNIFACLSDIDWASLSPYYHMAFSSKSLKNDIFVDIVQPRLS